MRAAAPSDIAAVVLEPAPGVAPPLQVAGAVAVLSFEGLDEELRSRRWVVAEAAAGTDAADLLVALTEAVEAEPAVAFTARGLEEDRSPLAPTAAATHVMPVPVAAPAAAIADLDRWYRDEHTPLLLREPDWLRVRRYAVESVAGAAWSRLALHDLASADVLAAPPVRAAMATPWRRRLARQSWFLSEGRVPLRIRYWSP